MTDKLKPCPFCGSEAHHYPDGDMEGYSIHCSNYSCVINTFGYLAAKEAEDAWNKRANNTLPPQSK
ncbi:Lar family restriction alleviation protein [Xenorhabdus bovienii]|uniref:Lar family restriction alleviation protein n=1 Tax=Xenorhabdus bovienii TaxID=40576 RepID=UPI000AF96607|nr:Lar family restriction alleviation protein [Xenorhabdus bovienii]